MAIVKLELTEDIIQLVSNIHFKNNDECETPDNENENVDNVSADGDCKCLIDYENLFGYGNRNERIAMVLGKYNEHIKGSEEDFDGRKYPQVLTTYFGELYTFITEHMTEIEEIVHQFACKGGVVPGTYICKSYDHIWKLKNK